MAAKRGIKVYRVYFNRRGAPKGQAFIVDTGQGTRRRYFETVLVTVPTVFYYTGEEPDWIKPIAWATAKGNLKTSYSKGSAEIS